MSQHALTFLSYMLTGKSVFITHFGFMFAVCGSFFFFLSSVCANILHSSGPTHRKAVEVKPGDEQLNTPSHFKSDSTLNKLRGQLLINRYTLTSWIDWKREVQWCRSLTAGHFIHGSDLKRSLAAGNVRRTVQSALALLQAGRQGFVRAARISSRLFTFPTIYGHYNFNPRVPT